MPHNFRIHDAPQHLDDGTANPLWLQARIGRVTGTSADAMLAKGQGVQRANLLEQKAVEQLTGKSMEKDFSNGVMLQGLAREPVARSIYEAKTGLLVETCGFLSHLDLMAGCSIDGYINDFEGLISIKCPELLAHIETARTGKIGLKYQRQIRHEQFITGAQWTDFVSFNPDLPERLQLVIQRVPRDAQALAEHEAELRTFLAAVDVEYRALKTMAEGLAVSA